MKVIDPGHHYLLDSYDGGEPIDLLFMKREGEGYPGNVGHHPGTNCQEVLRGVIDRVRCLDGQIHSAYNDRILDHLRTALYYFERRAAVRHNRTVGISAADTNMIENIPACKTCGHIECGGH